MRGTYVCTTTYYIRVEILLSFNNNHYLNQKGVTRTAGEEVEPCPSGHVRNPFCSQSEMAPVWWGEGRGMAQREAGEERFKLLLFSPTV